MGSPVTFGSVEAKFARATIREPKSAVFEASMPLSKIAIAGA